MSALSRSACSGFGCGGLRSVWAGPRVPARPGKFCTVFVVTVVSCMYVTSADSLHLCRYGATKWASEVQLQQLHERHGVPVSIFRCGMILAHSRRVQGFLIARADAHLTSGGLLCVCSLLYTSKLCRCLCTVYNACDRGELHVVRGFIVRHHPKIQALQVYWPDKPDRLLHAPAGRHLLHGACACLLLQGPRRPRPPLRWHVGIPLH